MQEEDPELKLAVSYYHLYNASQNEEPQVSAGKKTVRETKTVEGSATTAASLFWVEDTSWTEKDESEAKETLRRTAMRCSYRPSGTDQGKEDDYDAAAWNKFYIDHQTNFFKDRHYFATAFPSEFGDTILTVSDDRANDPQLRCLVEIGCGVGNALLPLLQEEEIDDGSKDEKDLKNRHRQVKKWSVYGLDLSSVAIDLLKKDARFRAAANENRAHAFCCDIARTEGLPKPCIGVATVTTLLFCLSAIHPDKHVQAVRNVCMALKPGAVLVFRDYGRYDQAQMQLAERRGRLLSENYYRKADGTTCFYFTTEDLVRLCCRHGGLEVLECKYLRRIYKNRSSNETRRRVWVQGRFRKPVT